MSSAGRRGPAYTIVREVCKDDIPGLSYVRTPRYEPEREWWVEVYLGGQRFLIGDEEDGLSWSVCEAEWVGDGPAPEGIGLFPSLLPGWLGFSIGRDLDDGYKGDETAARRALTEWVAAQRLT